MKVKPFFSLLIVGILLVGCLVIPAGADVAHESASQAIIRATGGIEESISPKALMTLAVVSLDIGETITYNCTYTPSGSSVDFGFIAPDGYFYYSNCTTGRINKTVRVSQRGSYTLAIWNNSDETVTVTGTVTY